MPRYRPQASGWLRKQITDMFVVMLRWMYHGRSFTTEGDGYKLRVDEVLTGKNSKLIERWLGNDITRNELQEKLNAAAGSPSSQFTQPQKKDSENGC